jgi:hypothetical protein
MTLVPARSKRLSLRPMKSAYPTHPSKVTEEQTESGIRLWDIDGNSYSTGYFGDAGWWMTENPATTHYADGARIATVNVEGSDNSTAYVLTAGYPPFRYPQSQQGTLIITRKAPVSRVCFIAGRLQRAALPLNPHLHRVPRRARVIVLRAPAPEVGSCRMITNGASWRRKLRMYSTTEATAWDTGWPNRSENDYAGGYGRKMKSPVATAGFSTDGTRSGKAENGFSALFVSSREFYGTNADYWTSSQYDANKAWTRGLGRSTTGVLRSKIKKNP